MSKPGSKGHGKSGHLSDRLRQKARRRYFTFTAEEKAAATETRVITTAAAATIRVKDKKG